MRMLTAANVSHPELVEGMSRELWMRLWSRVRWCLTCVTFQIKYFQGHSQTQNLGGGKYFWGEQNFRSWFYSFLWKLIGCSLNRDNIKYKVLNHMLLIWGDPNPIPPGGGGRKCRHRFQLLRTSLIFKQNLPNVATLTKIYWGTRFWKNFASRASHVAHGKPRFRHHVYSKFDFLIFFSIN